MPLPPIQFLFDHACGAFRQAGITLPVDWQPPGSQFSLAMPPAQRCVFGVGADSLLRQATLNHYHVQTARDISVQLEKFLYGMARALHTALGTWLAQAVMRGVVVNGSVGELRPGGVLGPSLGPLILQSAPRATLQEEKYACAVAKAVQRAWQDWHWGLNGVLAYPSLALVSGPQAAPTCNTPLILGRLVSSQEPALEADPLGAAMVRELNDSCAQHAQPVLQALAAGFSRTWHELKGNTQIINVVAVGPVPGFSPPAVCAAPVVNGHAAGETGCFQ